MPARPAWYADAYARLYAAIAQVSGCRVVVDSSKHASLAFCLHMSADIDLRVLHVVRDSRAVAYSWTKRIRRPEAADDSGEYMATFSPARPALLWNTLNLGFALLSSRGVPVRQIRYEDFLADPPGSMAELAEFACGPGDFTDVIAGFLARDRASLGSSHTASGNPMRFATGSMLSALTKPGAMRAHQGPGRRLGPDAALAGEVRLPAPVNDRSRVIRAGPGRSLPRAAAQIPRPRLCRARTTASGLTRPAITATARYGRGSRGLARTARCAHLQAVARSPQAAAAKAIRPARRA